MKLIVYTDGGSRWNPGIAGIWVYITNGFGEEIEKRYKNIWIKTNNEAEYLWAYYGMKRAIELWATTIELCMDSQLVINQLSWDWKIKKDELREIHTDIVTMIQKAEIELIYKWVPREENKEADRLSNVAMDEK